MKQDVNDSGGFVSLIPKSKLNVLRPEMKILDLYCDYVDIAHF